jgi:hypothetical protein
MSALKSFQGTCGASLAIWMVLFTKRFTKRFICKTMSKQPNLPTQLTTVSGCTRGPTCTCYEPRTNKAPAASTLPAVLPPQHHCATLPTQLP